MKKRVLSMVCIICLALAFNTNLSAEESYYHDEYCQHDGLCEYGDLCGHDVEQSEDNGGENIAEDNSESGNETTTAIISHQIT